MKNTLKKLLGMNLTSKCTLTQIKATEDGIQIRYWDEVEGDYQTEALFVNIQGEYNPKLQYLFKLNELHKLLNQIEKNIGSEFNIDLETYSLWVDFQPNIN
jgi:hypothetical protein